MKRKYFYIPLIAGVAALASCKDKTTTTPDSSAAAAGQSVSSESQPAPIQATSTADARAEKFGFASRLPKNVEIYDALFNGREAFDAFLKTSLGKFVLKRMEDEGISMKDLEGNEAAAAQIAMYSEEYFSAYGEGTAESLALAEELFDRIAFYGARFGMFMSDGVMREGSRFQPKGPKPILDGPLKGAPKDLLKLFASAEMPSFYQGAKVSDEESREQVLASMEQIVALFGQAEGASEEVSVERAGAEFSGFKVSGAKLAEMIDERAEKKMKQIFEGEDVDDLKKSLATKNIVALTGVIDDYVILFLGKSTDDFVLVDKVGDSLCASQNIVFADQYLGKDILSIGFRNKDIIKTVGNVEAVGYRILSSFFKGASKGLSDAGSLGDTAELEALFDSLDSQGRQLASLFSGTDAGYVLYLEDGVKMEAIGGSNMPAIDFDSAHTLAPMGTGEGTLLFANWSNNKDYQKKVLEYMDTLGETAYLAAKQVSGFNINDRDFKEFKQGLDLFDQKFRGDAVGIWKALSGDLASGLGSEAAIIIDMNGSLPKVPGVPRAVIKEGKIPHIAYASVVSDRSKLQASWKKINASVENLLATASEMSGKEIPMQDMMSSEKEGLTTWWTSIPFTGNDFLPSISVSDKLFFASTSKSFSEQLAARFKQGGGEARKGAWLQVDFKVLNQYAVQWMDLVDKNADAIFRRESAKADFKANKAMIYEVIKACESIESLTVHTRREGGRTRTSFHLKAQ